MKSLTEFVLGLYAVVSLREAVTPSHETGDATPSSDQPQGGGTAISPADSAAWLREEAAYSRWSNPTCPYAPKYEAAATELTALRDVAEAAGKAVEQADLVDEPDSHPEDMRLAIINIGDWLHAALDDLKEAQKP